MILALTSLLLFLSFIIHLAWWRVKMPVHTTNALLIVFFCIPLLMTPFYLLYISTHASLQTSDIIRLALLYSSCALVYIILYSAIEQQSPTLAIIYYIDSCGFNGCKDEDLRRYLSADNEIKHRLNLMEQGDWIMPVGTHWRLTKKGYRISYLFSYAAMLFGLKIGG